MKNGITELERWPEWAPQSLRSLRESFSLLSDLPLQEKSIEIIDALCTNPAMESVWREINSRALEPDYHRDFVLVVFGALRSARSHELTPAEFRKKRLQAAKAAHKLGELLNEIGLGGQTIFPILGTRAMSGAVHYFLQGQGAVVPDDDKWAQELTSLNATLVTNAPGVGSLDSFLSTLTKRLESSDPNYWPAHRADNGTHPKAVNFISVVGPFIEQTCGQPLLGTISKLASIFFPGLPVPFDNTSISRILRSRKKD
ncbi:MAG: hypothetical protein KA435_04435 [Azonexus sp.]|nr:hypothetical protein [Azonexus sp.]MBP6202288.1 hypothetical protein [Azonexus sp.]